MPTSRVTAEAGFGAPLATPGTMPETATMPAAARPPTVMRQRRVRDPFMSTPSPVVRTLPVPGRRPQVGGDPGLDGRVVRDIPAWRCPTVGATRHDRARRVEGEAVQLVDGRMVLSPTDLVGHLACAHLTTLDRAVALGLREPPEVDDPSGDLVRRLGDAHERAVLAEMRRTLDVAEIPRSDDLVAAEQLTLDAMKRGADVVYQATFFDGRWRGHADFLIRNDKRASDLGDWSYDVADTKLARHLKVPALLQMAVYASRLTQLQGVPPDRLTVILGTQEQVSVPYVDVAAYARKAPADFEGWLAEPPATYPVRVDHCAICPWAEQCRRRWRADDDLVLVPHLRRAQREWFRQAGIVTVDQLGAATDAALASVSSVGDVTKRNLAAQARLQVEARNRDEPPYEPILPVEVRRGLALLPEPDDGDLFLDLEGDPFYPDQGLEYLWGVSDMADGFAV